MYREMADEEDNKLAERCQKDAEGILIFVRPYLLLSIISLHDQNIDWFILRRCCRIGRRDRPGSQAKLPRHVHILSTRFLPTQMCLAHPSRLNH
jgi:hypothetical protein